MAKKMNAVRWRVDDKQWKVGTAALVPFCSRAAEKAVGDKVEDGFRKSKERVHVESGALKDSGRIEKRNMGTEVVYEVIYGGMGTGVDYAGYEELLHPFLEPSMVDAVSGDFVDFDALTVGPFGP